jgi:hypothetical protein
MFIRNEYDNLRVRDIKDIHIKKLRTITFDGSYLKIQDRSINEILTKLNFIDSKIYNFTPA